MCVLQCRRCRRTISRGASDKTRSRWAIKLCSRDEVRAAAFVYNNLKINRLSAVDLLLGTDDMGLGVAFREKISFSIK